MMKMMWRIALAAWFATCMVTAYPGHAQALTQYAVNVTDPVLKPTGNHVIARYYLLWDGRANCAVGQTARIVLALHGGGGTPENFATKFVPQGCYVVAYPYGTDKKSSGWITKGTNLSWYAYGVEQGSYKNNDGTINAVDENQFVLAVLADIRSRTGLTAAPVFGAAVSKGAMLSYHIACDLGIFSAFVISSGTITDTTCTPATKAPVFHEYGTADTNVCWVYTGSSCNPWPPAKPLVEAWQGVPPTAPNVLLSLTGMTHGWPELPVYDMNAAAWAWLDAR